MMLTVDIKDCARCGQDHPGLRFKIMNNPSDDYRYWALCPVKSDPILLKVEHIKD